MTRRFTAAHAIVAGLIGVIIGTGVAVAQDGPPGRPLVIPQVEGARQGRIVGRAIACGAPRDRIDAALRAARERVLAAVGRAFTQDRYEPELARAIKLETDLPAPSETACARALAAFDEFAREGPAREGP